MLVQAATDNVAQIVAVEAADRSEAASLQAAAKEAAKTDKQKKKDKLKDKGKDKNKPGPAIPSLDKDNDGTGLSLYLI